MLTKKLAKSGGVCPRLAPVELYLVCAPTPQVFVKAHLSLKLLLGNWT